MNLTIPQIVLFKHFYFKQRSVEIKSPKPQTSTQAQHAWEEFRKGL